MAFGFTFAGLEPEGLNGNDTFETRKEGSSVGAFGIEGSDDILVSATTSVVGSVETGGVEGGGADVADVYFHRIGEYTTAVEIGVQLQFDNALSALLGSGVGGGTFHLEFDVSGAATASHSLTVNWGTYAVAEDLTALILERFGVVDLYYAAGAFWQSKPEDWTVVDDVLFDSYFEYIEEITAINNRMYDGEFGMLPELWKATTQSRLDDIIAAITNSAGPQHPSITALGDAIKVHAQDYRDVIDSLFVPVVYFDAAEVDPDELEWLEFSQFNLTWCGLFNVDWSDVTFNVSGWTSTSDVADGELIPFETLTDVSYGTGVRTVEYVLPAPVPDGTDGADRFEGRDIGEDYRGGAGDDVILGFGGADTLRGNGDDDVIKAGRGNDELIGGSGNDNLRGGDGADTLIGGRGFDTLGGGDSGDLLNGGDGLDVFFGGAGNDTVFGGGGADEIFGGFDDDVLRGGGGADTIGGGQGDDEGYGGGGGDRIQLGWGEDYADGGAGDDTILGEGNRDTLEGGDGADSLDGGGSKDTLKGGEGNDTLIGGRGSDTFVFRSGEGSDDILDFETGADVLRLQSALWDGSLTASDIVSTYAEVSEAGVLFQFDGGETVLLAGLATTVGLADDIDIV